MARVCEYSGKKPTTGNRIVRKGLAKKKGGIGLHTTAVNRRRFKPNLQKIKIRDENGTVRRVKVCAKYIKAGKFEKA